MNTQHQRWCIWTIVPFVAIYIIGFVGIAGFVPPSPPTWSGQELVDFYNANRQGIRAGQLIGLVMSSLILFWAGAISAQMARIEGGRLPMLSLIQFVSAGVLVVFFMLCSLIWSIAAFREDMSPALLRMLHDAGWLIFVMAYPEYVVQLVCIAVIGFMDQRPQPYLPRWACFFTLWAALMGIGGGFSTFFKTGPFAWNGLFGFWLPVAFYLVWMLLVMLPCTLKAIGRQEAEQATAARVSPGLP